MPTPARAPQLAFHTAAFNSSNWDFLSCVSWAADRGVAAVECGMIGGVTWAHGLGYYPHVALWQDPYEVRRAMECRGVGFSQVDAAFPLSVPDGVRVGLEYVQATIRWAHLAGCPRVDTTDAARLADGWTEDEAIALMRFCYKQIVPVARRYRVIVNVEPHGYCTTHPERLSRVLAGLDPEWLGVNMDTGNTFIAGQDPTVFLERFADRVRHVHIKDVAPALADQARGRLTGIATSHCAIGSGVLAAAIEDCLRILAQHGYDGPLSLESDAGGGPLLEQGIGWMRARLADLYGPATLPGGGADGP